MINIKANLHQPNFVEKNLFKEKCDGYYSFRANRNRYFGIFIAFYLCDELIQLIYRNEDYYILTNVAFLIIPDYVLNGAFNG